MANRLRCCPFTKSLKDPIIIHGIGYVYRRRMGSSKGFNMSLVTKHGIHFFIGIKPNCYFSNVWLPQNPSWVTNLKDYLVRTKIWRVFESPSIQITNVSLEAYWFVQKMILLVSFLFVELSINHYNKTVILWHLKTAMHKKNSENYIFQAKLWSLRPQFVLNEYDIWPISFQFRLIKYK